MNGNILKPFIVFIICIIITFACAGFAAHIRNGFGTVQVTSGFFTPEKPLAKDSLPVRIAYKLYKPEFASSANPAPAVLAMHGYQSDKDTSSAFCIELARRGIVVLAIDHYGHGSTTPGMRGRGWAQYNIKNIDKPISGPKRFMLMMTFSIQDFFHNSISKGMADSSMGGKSAWQYLSALPFVDSNRMGITGHSMGTWASWSVVAEFPEHKAIVLQSGETFPILYYDFESIKFNNVLLLQALVEEFEQMRDYQQQIRDLEKKPVRYRDFMGQDAPVQWNKTYGSFYDGTARRMELIETTHRLVTFNSHAMKTAINWFSEALNVKTHVQPADHIFMLKEAFNLLAMLAAMASMLPLFLILVQFKYFKCLALPLKSNPKQLNPKSRAITVFIAILISGATFPFLTQLGHGLLPLPENIFRMTIGNGFGTWLGFLMIIALITLCHWYKKAGWTLSDLGLEGHPEKGINIIRPANRSKRIILRAIIAALILTCVMYILVSLSDAIFKIDFRFIWPIFRPFNLVRLGQFFVYLPVYAAFFTINAGAKLYGQLRLPEFKLKRKIPGAAFFNGALTQLSWWGFSILVMLGGLFIIALIEYIPFIAGAGPGADLLFSSLFGGPFMSVLILLVPQFALFFFFSTWLYRKSGTVYTGSFVLAILATWVLTGGSAVF